MVTMVTSSNIMKRGTARIVRTSHLLSADRLNVLICLPFSSLAVKSLSLSQFNIIYPIRCRSATLFAKVISLVYNKKWFQFRLSHT